MSEVEIKINEEDDKVNTGKEMDKKEGKKAEDLKEQHENSREKSKEKKVKKIEEMTKRELLEKLKKTELKAKENYDLYMRTYAEMENIKKRGKKEREDLAKFANESLIKEILPTIDNLEKAISHANNDANHSVLIKGLEMTLSGLMKTLEKSGLKKVEAAGKPFDPNFHEAISQQIDDKVVQGHIIMELQKGYLLNERLIRPSMVVVSQGNSKSEGVKSPQT
ncbi:MAG: nucleotide exchange factor GrpE [Deltaproteobacteria bacterium]|nr:MAG: nucleotide exchange factor GrpE [Deltaproteobacteria bacterium]